MSQRKAGHGATAPENGSPAADTQQGADDNGKQKPRGTTWFSRDPVKSAGEKFFFFSTFTWITGAFIVIHFEWYQGWSDLGWNTCALVLSLPTVLVPLLFPMGVQAEKNLPWYDRYTTKANIWIAIFNFVGNYFWTHYFFALLGAKYLFPIKYFFNKIPPLCFFLTQPYFQTYHVVASLAIRKFTSGINNRFGKFIAISIIVVAFSGAFSFAEAWTLEHFPYYDFDDYSKLYKVGIWFYALYFLVSFPMFYALDEFKTNKGWSLTYTITNSLAASMIVFTLCDFWRLIIGHIDGALATTTLPFL